MAACSGPECTRDAAIKGLCTGHYQQQRRGVELQRLGKRGFASMSPERQREIARLGGIRAHERGTAHQWTSDEAKAAGRKGGIASRGGRGKLTAQ